jgi:sec-independent protein translocase protein TatB
MFGLSLAEVAVVAVVALIVLGPDKLPAVMRGLAKGYRQLARLRTEFSKAVEENLGPELTGLKPEMDKLARLRIENPLAGALAAKVIEPARPVTPPPGPPDPIIASAPDAPIITSAPDAPMTTPSPVDPAPATTPAGPATEGSPSPPSPGVF